MSLCFGRGERFQNIHSPNVTIILSFTFQNNWLVLSLLSKKTHPNFSYLFFHKLGRMIECLIKCRENLLINSVHNKNTSHVNLSLGGLCEIVVQNKT